MYRTVPSGARGEDYVTRYRQCRGDVDGDCRFRWSTVEVHKVKGPDDHALDAGNSGA